MRCFALRTTCSVDSVAARRVGAAFEAMMFAQCLAPLSKTMDAVGDYGIDALARSVAERDSNGFGALIAARLERDAR